MCVIESVLVVDFGIVDFRVVLPVFDESLSQLVYFRLRLVGASGLAYHRWSDITIQGGQLVLNIQSEIGFLAIL